MRSRCFCEPVTNCDRLIRQLLSLKVRHEVSGKPFGVAVYRLIERFGLHLVQLGEIAIHHLTVMGRWWDRPANWTERRSRLHVTRQQLVFGHGDLSVNHAVKIQLTAVSKGKVFRRVRECFRVQGILNCRHEHEQRG